MPSDLKMAASLLADKFSVRGQAARLDKLHLLPRVPAKAGLPCACLQARICCAGSAPPGIVAENGQVRCVAAACQPRLHRVQQAIQAGRCGQLLSVQRTKM